MGNAGAQRSRFTPGKQCFSYLDTGQRPTLGGESAAAARRRGRRPRWPLSKKKMTGCCPGGCTGLGGLQRPVTHPDCTVSRAAGKGGGREELRF